MQLKTETRVYFDGKVLLTKLNLSSYHHNLSSEHYVDNWLAIIEVAQIAMCAHLQCSGNFLTFQVALIEDVLTCVP